MNSLQPTIVHDPTPASLTQGTADVSKANIGFVVGDRRQFVDETTALVRNRLFAAASVIFVTLTAGFIGNLVNGTTTLWWFRIAILTIVGVAVYGLRTYPSLSLPKLRILELVVFGSVFLQIVLMFSTRLSGFVVQQDAISASYIVQQLMMSWCVLVFIYGTLMPNTWKRAAAIMIPASLLPFLLIVFWRWWSPNLASLLDQQNATSPLPFPLVSALIAIFASHVINAARREAFKARQFGQYRLMERLGAGGMGEVHKAEHVLLKRPCAIKLIKPSSDANSAAIARFEKEVKNTAKLTHWNTIEIYDYGRTDDGTFYYVMELLPGMSLDDMVGRYGSLPPERVAYLLRQICGALQEAHSVGLIHRDIKPGNIFVSQRGGVFDVAKLLDFGLVKEVSDPSAAGSLNEGSFSGTPLYMPPEQASTYEDVDGRADIYSLGAVAYFLLTGEPPFPGDSVVKLLVAHRRDPVAPPSSKNPDIPADLDEIILKCMAKQPGDRFQDAEALGKAFEHCSVAGKWGPEQAAAWWKSHRDQPVTTSRHDEQTKIARTLEATLDDVPSSR